MICDICAEPAIAFQRGTDPVHDLFLLNKGSPSEKWCAVHWPWGRSRMAQLKEKVAHDDAI